ncbi:MAG: hypothetical protein WD739_11300 [Actinomycetota bacterium]
MAADIQCPACGEDERLSGKRSGEIITITCERCGVAWERDPRATCPTCGGKDLVSAPRSVVEKVRGDQVTIVGYVRESLCRSCDADTLARLMRSRAPLPPAEMPVTSRSNWGGSGR